MNVVLFGGTGMVGQGVLRECLLDAGVEQVLSVVRSPSGTLHSKLRELVHRDFLDFSSVASELTGFDACFYCLGVSSIGLSETAYSRVTHDFTVAAAKVLAERNPNLTFVFVSGGGVGDEARKHVMWARVKGKAEDAILSAPFKASYVFRPGMIQPLHGIRSKTKLYNVLYALLAPLASLLRRRYPRYVTTTEQIGRAMLAVARRGAPKRILENADINTL